MLILVPTKCPCCNEEKDVLKLWRKIGDKYFYLCEDCCKLESPTMDQLIMIGFTKGFENCQSKIKNFLEELK